VENITGNSIIFHLLATLFLSTILSTPKSVINQGKFSLFNRFFYYCDYCYKKAIFLL